MTTARVSNQRLEALRDGPSVVQVSNTQLESLSLRMTLVQVSGMRMDVLRSIRMRRAPNIWVTPERTS